MMPTSLANELGVPNVLFAEAAVTERVSHAVLRRLSHDWHLGWFCVGHDTWPRTLLFNTLSSLRLSDRSAVSCRRRLRLRSFDTIDRECVSATVLLNFVAAADDFVRAVIRCL